MTTETRSGDTYPADTYCKFPGCTEPRRPASGPGPKPEHCKDHTRVQALRERKRLAEKAEAERRIQEPQRPISDGIAAFASMVKRYEQLVIESAEIAAALADPAALAREIAEVQRTADAQVAEAEAARDAAERDAAAARDERDAAQELRNDALALVDDMEQKLTAAEESKAEAKNAVHEARDAVREMRSERDTARRDAAQARTDLEQTHTRHAQQLAELARVNNHR